jgi:hypothetical protein
MTTTEDQLKSFTQFVHQQTTGEDVELHLPELFDLWMFQNVGESDHAENVAAVNASINDFLSGERGTPAGEDSKQLRDRVRGPGQAPVNPDDLK